MSKWSSADLAESVQVIEEGLRLDPEWVNPLFGASGDKRLGKKQRFQCLDAWVEEHLGFAGFKVCRRCVVPKPRDDFRPNSRVKSGLSSWCLQCHNEASAESRRPSDPVSPSERSCRWCGEKFVALGPVRICSDECRVWVNRFRGYGLDRSHFDEIWDAQKGRCGACRCLLDLNDFHIDHDHDTDLVRGFLCPPCNNGLGFFRDSSVNLRRAAVYLENHARSQQQSLFEE